MAVYRAGMSDRRSLRRVSRIPVAAAALVIGLKGVAYLLTGSVGLLSDAVESLTNLLGALTMMAMLSIAIRPPDEEHPYGHGKAEYFASGFEGALIVVAALGIGYIGVSRLLDPRPIEAAGWGILLAGVASAVNGGVAALLLRTARRHDAISLEAHARHLLADVWTSAGVIAGVAVTAVTGWLWLDALIALAVAGHIVISGVGLLRRSVLGLLDTGLPEEERMRVDAVLTRFEARRVRFHALRTRRAGRYRFVSVHVLVPGEWSVRRGHELLEEVEAEVRGALPSVSVFTHLEPLEDPVSWEDTRLHRSPPEPRA